MTSPNPVATIILLALLALATWADLRKRRIPNVLTYPAIGIGLIVATAFGGLDGLREHALGAALGLGMLFPLFIVRWMGAGDVKLMAAIGAVMGTEFVWFACLWAAVFGACIALAGLIYSRRLVLALSHMYYSRLLPQAGGSFISS